MIEWVQGGDMMTIGQNIKTIRKEKKITQAKLAEMTGIAEITIRQYEAGKYEPRLENVIKISNALGVTPNQIDVKARWNESFDLTHLQQGAKLFDLIISMYGEDVASTINDFLSLSDEGQLKASEYIDLLMQKYKK